MNKILLIIFLILTIHTQVYAGYTDLNNLINQQRNTKLISSTKLDQIAFCRAKYLIDNNLWTHNNYGKCFNKYGIYNNFGEILAKGYYSDNDIVNAWLNSPSHNRVMKMANWHYIGSSKVGDITTVVFN